MKLAVFDFDSTLMDGETIDVFAKALGLQQEVSRITEAAMQGELDFFGSLTQRVALLKGLKLETVEALSAKLPYMPGAKEVVSYLKSKDYKVVCFSGGFRNATKHTINRLGIDADFSNMLHHKDGLLTGHVGGDMMFDSSKGDMIVRLQNLLGVSKEDTLVVGDGANDRSMFEHADTRIAFCAKPILKAYANIIIDQKDLSLIIREING